MSRSKVFFLALLLGVLSMGNAVAQSDDVYYDPKSSDKSGQSSPDYQQQHDNQGSGNYNNNGQNNRQDGYNSNSTSNQSYSGNSYNNNNGGSYNGNSYSNGAADDDYYYDNDYNYSTRLRRYYSPGYSMSYYDDWYTPSYYWGSPVISFGYTPWYYHRYYSPFYDPFWPAPTDGKLTESTYPVYSRQLKIKIAQTPSGKNLYDATVNSEGANGSLPSVMPYMIRSAFTDFPGKNGAPKRVDLKMMD